MTWLIITGVLGRLFFLNRFDLVEYGMTSPLIIRAPDDWHCHLRDGVMLARTVSDQARYFSRSMVMPNLVSPVVSVQLAEAYYQRILQHIPLGSCWQPCMTLYMTETLTEAMIQQAKASEQVLAIKLYPAGATTLSDAGVSNPNNIYRQLAAMEAVDLPLLVHGEVVDHGCDIFDREARFIDQYLQPITQRFPQLRIVLEHITTSAAVQFVREASKNVAATITPQHLLFNRNDLLVGGLKPHYYCLPILKRSQDQEALIAAAISNDPSFFLGTDSAPHVKSAKQSACGCAGIYSAHAALEFYATVFEEHHALDRLEGFASIFGANFYQLPLNAHKVCLTKQAWPVPEELSFGEETVVPLLAGQNIAWQVRPVAATSINDHITSQEKV